MILIMAIITILYLTLIGAFIRGFDKVEFFKLEDLPSKTRFSIIIPFRNESDNLMELLKSMSLLNYPKQLFEIIFVDDDSEDNSVEIIEKFLGTKTDLTKASISIIKNIRASNSPKKDAITSAIIQAKNEWILTTDADCSLPKYWLDSFDEFIQKTNAKCIAGPVTYTLKKGFLCRFQLLDFLSLQGATIGGFGINKPFLCNGANFGYQKTLFKQLNGFSGNNNIASGDDVFLLEKIVQLVPSHIHYLKCEQAIVTTQPQTSWGDLIAQRIRWAAKTSLYNNWFGKLTGLIVLSMNTIAIIGLFLSILGILKFKILFYVLFIKFNIDLLLIFKTATFFNQKSILMHFISGQIIYPFFSTYTAFLSFFRGYQWKGRNFKR